MSCFHTLTAYRDERDELTFKKPHVIKEILQLPCGKCIGCKLDHANDWATRCWCEMQSWTNNCFITLTYNDENLPENGYLQKKDLQDFMKRLRYYYQGIESWENPLSNKTENPIRFLACGEYGPSGTRRPHYHILMFNWKPDKLKFYKENFNGDRLFISKELTKIWGKGFVVVGELNYKSACYVARYCTKKMFNGVKNKDLLKAKVQPEFILMSRNGGIGIKYWEKYQNEILNREGILIKTKDKVKNKRIPKYFERKFKEQDENKYTKYQTKKVLKGRKIIAEILKNTSMTESEYKEMQERQLIERGKILRRDNFI